MLHSFQKFSIFRLLTVQKDMRSCEKKTTFSFILVVIGNLDPDPRSSLPKGMKGSNADPDPAF